MSGKKAVRTVPVATLADQAKNGDAAKTHSADHGPLSTRDSDEQWKAKGGKIEPK